MSYRCARAKLSAQSDFVYLSVYYLYIVILYGDVAQLARAPALQAGGQEFDSPYLHQNRFNIYLKHIEKYIDKLMKGKLAYESMRTIKPKESEKAVK